MYLCNIAVSVNGYFTLRIYSGYSSASFIGLHHVYVLNCLCLFGLFFVLRSCMYSCTVDINLICTSKGQYNTSSYPVLLRKMICFTRFCMKDDGNDEQKNGTQFPPEVILEDKWSFYLPKSPYFVFFIYRIICYYFNNFILSVITASIEWLYLCNFSLKRFLVL